MEVRDISKCDLQLVITEKHIRNIAIYAFPKFVSYGINLVTLSILTRLLVPEDFGIVILAWIFPTIAVNIITCGLTSAAQRYYFEYRKDETKLSALYFSLQVFLYFFFLFSTVAVFFLKDVISQLTIKSNAYGVAIFITFIAAYLVQVINFYLYLYQNMEKAKLNAFFTTMQAVITSGSGLFFVWYCKMSYMGLVYGTLAGSLIVCVSMCFYFNRNMTPIFSRQILMENIKYGLQIEMKSFTGFINKFFDKYMLNNMISLSAVGVYNIGQTVGNSMFFLMNTVWSSFQPVCYKEVFDKGQGASWIVGRLFTFFTFIALLPLLLLILFTQEIITVTVPASYYGAIDIIIVILGGIATNVFGMYGGVQYAYSKKPFWIFPITLIGTVINIIANIIFISIWGLFGAGVSMVITYSLTNLFLLFVGQRLYRIRYEWKMLGALFGIIAGAMITALYLRQSRFNVMATISIKLFFVFLFFLLGIQAKLITRDTIQKLKSIFLKVNAEVE